jgi:hypothetical protein
MGMKLTFKEYLESKERLREAIAVTPKQTIQYTVKKYCKLVVGESKDEKEQINLKPNQKIIVEWLYNDIDNPTPKKIIFEGVCPNIDSEDHSTYWQPQKLQKWLLRNTLQDERS